MPPDPSALRDWWPTTQSLDLVEGSIEDVAKATSTVFAKIAQYSGDTHTANWQTFKSLELAFSSVPYFDNVGSHLLLLPTHSKWVVLWRNSFLCDGSDSICLPLTRQHGLTTIHWSAHDDWTTFQSGAMFHYRRNSAVGLVERRVQAAQTDKRWDFFEQGEPLPEEDIEGYSARRKRDRLNEKRVIELLARLDAHPWDERFYALSKQKVFCLSRPLPAKAIRRAPDEVNNRGP